ncbi:MAG: DUF3473 domain-containing protein [Candidatus Brocadiae bacterium]|nr:DUF3473 domain-containing protein [Candidatus Brocadiia bacterium]
MINAFSVDVEDYFQVSNFNSFINPDSWKNFSLRVHKNMENILKLLDQFSVKGTFFILGWLAQKLPQMIVDIHREGHEIACHGYQHELVYDLGPEGFRQDIKKAKAILQDISGQEVIGYRAPSYSITNDSLWALAILQEEGFLYDSSIFPVYHPRYGIPGSPRHPYVYSINQAKLYEFPPATLKLGKFHLPVAGGGYFRLFPYDFTRWAMKKINHEGYPFVFYMHPWEIDPKQPRFENAKMMHRFRHYLNLSKTKGRLQKLLQDFHFGTMKEMFTANSQSVLCK